VLAWGGDHTFDRAPNHGPYLPPDNLRRSTYELRAVVPSEAPPGVYQFRGFTFATASGRHVKLNRERLGSNVVSFSIEILEEHPENTRPADFRFLYDK
jgi:hypothetical protein